MDLFELVEKYGTDKTLSKYTYTYADLFKPLKINALSSYKSFLPHKILSFIY